MTENYEMQLVGEEAKVAVEIINQGIDSRLEAFTRSEFDFIWHTTKGTLFPQSAMEQYDKEVDGLLLTWKLHCSIVPEEWGLFLRRLSEFADSDNDWADEADSLLGSILDVWYDLEPL